MQMLQGLVLNRMKLKIHQNFRLQKNQFRNNRLLSMKKDHSFLDE